METQENMEVQDIRKIILAANPDVSEPLYRVVSEQIMWDCKKMCKECVEGGPEKCTIFRNALMKDYHFSGVVQ